MTSARVLMLFSPATSPAASFMVSTGVSLAERGSRVRTAADRGRVVEVWVLVQVLLGQGRAGLAADGIAREILLELVVRVVGDIAQAATIHDGRFLAFRQEPMEFQLLLVATIRVSIGHL